MIEVRAFQGYRYNIDKVSNYDAVITPPYDVISDEERARLAAGSPANLVHALLPQANDTEDKYAAARTVINQWIQDGTLQQEDKPAYYLLRQQFTDLEGQHQTRCGFFAAIKLPEEGEHYVLGHERTFQGPVDDRIKLTEATEANLGAVFCLYNDHTQALKNFMGQMDTRDPDGIAHTIDGVTQEFWIVEDDPSVNEFFQGQTLYIADGHHRFQTACAYRDAQRIANPDAGTRPYDYALMGFVAFDDPGLKIYPPHRVVELPGDFDADAFMESLAKWFTIEAIEDGLTDQVETAPGECVMGIVLPGKPDHLLTLKEGDRVPFLGDDRGPSWRDLDVAVLHRGIIANIMGIPEETKHSYEKSLEGALAAGNRGDSIAFILRATKASQICACAEAGEPMPQKSTYFFPKLPSGVVIHRLR